MLQKRTSSRSLIGLATFFLTRLRLRVSIYIPAPLIAVGIGTALASTMWGGQGLSLISTKYGSIPTNFFVFTRPPYRIITPQVWLDIAYFVAAIVFISGVESLLCSSMADRLARTRARRFNPDKEFWGQGLVQIITPLINGFPCTGALRAHGHQHSRRRRYPARRLLQMPSSNSAWPSSSRIGSRACPWPASAASCCGSRAT
ncbi:MAG: SulP family inorganic anion transporter [Verrucomicrobiota bacterium]